MSMINMLFYISTSDKEVTSKLILSIKAGETQAHRTEISRTPQDSLFAQQKSYEGTNATDAAGCDENQLPDGASWTKYLPDFLLKLTKKSEPTE